MKRPKILVVAVAVLFGQTARAQVAPPAASPTPPDDTPSIRVGATIFANYTYHDSPTIKDADGNVVHASSFEVARAYINLTGNLSHRLSFRVTPDIAGRFSTSLTSTSSVTGGVPGERVTTTTTGGTSYDGSLVFRLKYAYGQLNLDDWLPKGSWIRLGQHQTPYVDFMENIYRYRFQGNVFLEREAFLNASDVGISGRFALPNDYGDIHAGFYNGETYTRPEVNDQKAFQIRGTLRPLPRSAFWKGLRLTGFHDADQPIRNGARDRSVTSVTFEHKRVNLGFDHFNASDRASGKAGTPEIKANGWSIWVTPRLDDGLEGLFRYDSMKPNEAVDARRKRMIAGVSYWFKTQKPDSAAILADLERVDYDPALSRPNEQRFSLHCLLAF